MEIDRTTCAKWHVWGKGMEIWTEATFVQAKRFTFLPPLADLREPNTVASITCRLGD